MTDEYWPNMIADWLENTDTEVPDEVAEILLKLEEAVHNKKLSGMLLQEGKIAALLRFVIELDMREDTSDD